MATNIVQINVSQTIAPAPSKLQKTGVIVTQGGTNTTANTVTLLTQLSDLTPILATAQAITSLTWLTSVVTATTTAPHGYTVGQTINLTIAGATPAGYNGTFACTITGANTFTYPLVSNPGAETISGTVISADKALLLADATTFFAQGSAVSIYVLELGAGDAPTGVTALTTFLAGFPNKYYAFKVPNGWDAEPTFPTLAGNYSSDTAKTYFFVTVSNSTYTNFATASPHKSIVMMIQAVAAPVTESSIMSMMYVILHYAPSNTNQVTPTAFSFLVGVTAYNPTPTQATTYKTSNVNYVDTGAEGGISNTILKWGVTADGRDFTYWYSVDWAQINLQLDLANAIINGSNNPQAPLYYNQRGINTLQAVAQGTMNRAITFGLGLAPITVTAVPFITYTTSNPSDYPLGVYNGLAVSYTPARGFTSITVNVNVTDFIAP